MTKKIYTFILLPPLLLLFFINGTFIMQTNSKIFEAGPEMMVTSQKVNYLLPDNEIKLPENEIVFSPRKYKLKDVHKFSGKHFIR